MLTAATRAGQFTCARPPNPRHPEPHPHPRRTSAVRPAPIHTAEPSFAQGVCWGGLGASKLVTCSTGIPPALAGRCPALPSDAGGDGHAIGSDTGGASAAAEERSRPTDRGASPLVVAKRAARTVARAGPEWCVAPGRAGTRRLRAVSPGKCSQTGQRDSPCGRAHTANAQLHGRAPRQSTLS